MLDALLVNGSSWREIMFHIVNTTKHNFFANDPDHPAHFFGNHIDHPDGPVFCNEDGLLKTDFFANDIYLLHMPACLKKAVQYVQFA